MAERGYVATQDRPKQTMSGEWRRVALGDLIDLQLSSVDKKSKINEQAVQLCNYTDVYNNSFIHAGMDFMLATATEREIARCSLAAGDVVITKDSEKHDDIGVPALVREDVPNLVCGYHLAILRPRLSEVHGTYLFYALSTDDSQQQFHSFANGVTRFGLRKADIGLVEIPLPPLPVQRAIANVLGTLDDKIELNRRMNETLEGMARALFKSWFVDFEPVRAKIDGRWRRGESLPDIPAEHYDLFPDRMVDSELGEIPEGWEVKALGTFGEIITGKTPSTKQPEYYGEDVPFLRIPDMHGKMYALKTELMLSVQGAESQSKKTLPPGSVSVSCIATPGLVVLNHRDTQTNQQINSIVPHDQLVSRYLYWTCCHLSSDIATGGLGGSVFGNMNKSTFSALLAIHPKPPTILRAFDALVSPIHAAILANEEEAHTLAAQRDALLPRLVSGELTVKDLERLPTKEGL